jgi:hypothetical protein
MTRIGAACRASLVCMVLCAPPGPARAQPFAEADRSNGEVVYAEKRCAACHVDKTGRDAAFMYRRDDRKVKTLHDLRRYVSLCNMELRLELFPEDERDVAAFLNHQYYRLAR